ncbi:ABC transporter permease [Paenibacillus apiarius]|uniref:ABC transporter permease n=1 Tax=Paenibacillus apiarius TaxID=46240 RepID=UPI0019806C9C|nr:hypothetical protein [Paenibacillus apiarius]MBN3525196.1 hypothetical protein [Paenibacillus apiarius]
MEIRAKLPSILLIIVFTAVGFCTNWVASTLFEYQLLEKISQGYVSNSAISFSLQNADSAEVKDFVDYLNPGDILYKSISENFKAVFFKETTSRMPLIQGRFFTKQDFFSGQSLALLGQAKRTQIFTKGGVPLYKYEGQTYEVIGIIGMDTLSKLDDMIMVNIDGIQNLDNNGVWSLDGSGKGDINTTFEKLKGYAMKQGWTIKEIDSSIEGTRRFFRNENIYQFIYFAVFFSFITCAAVITAYWVERRKHIIAIQKLCGYSSFLIFWDSFKTYFFISIISYTIGILLGIFALSANLTFISELIPAYVTTILTGMAFCMLPLAYFMSRWTDRAVRSVSR